MKIQLSKAQLLNARLRRLPVRIERAMQQALREEADLILADAMKDVGRQSALYHLSAAKDRV